MTEFNALHLAGQDQLKEVARYFAAQHGLRPESIADGQIRGQNALSTAR